MDVSYLEGCRGQGCYTWTNMECKGELLVRTLDRLYVFEQGMCSGLHLVLGVFNKYLKTPIRKISPLIKESLFTYELDGFFLKMKLPSITLIDSC